MTLIQESSSKQNKNTRAAVAFLKGKYNTVGTAASAENSHRGQFAKLIKKRKNHRVGAALHEVRCETVDLIFPDEEVERINKVKGSFKRKILAVELAAPLILDNKIKGPIAAAKFILYTFNISVIP